jgi:D-alanine-D-alanine ligase
MTKKEVIAILYGGKSGEHEVSLRSACSVYHHIDRSIYAPLLIGITKTGRWYLQPEKPIAPDTENLPLTADEAALVSAVPGDGLHCRGRRLDIDAAFPVLHGTNGEDGTVQGLLEICNIPYIGAGVLGSSLSMDKGAAKEIWASRGLPVVPFMRVEAEEFSSSSDLWPKKLKMLKDCFTPPLFVKPVRAGSSVGVSRIENWQALEKALEEALRYDTSALVEPAVNGREIECSVIGNFHTRSFPPGEILPSHSFYDYEAKYIDPDGAALLLPAKIDDTAAAELRRIAEEAYRSAGVEGMARVDFFLEKESGRILLNEINTIPGFTSISMFPRMCEAGGLPYPDLIRKMIVLGKERFEKRSRCLYSILSLSDTD